MRLASLAGASPALAAETLASSLASAAVWPCAGPQYQRARRPRPSLRLPLHPDGLGWALCGRHGLARARAISNPLRSGLSCRTLPPESHPSRQPVASLPLSLIGRARRTRWPSAGGCAPSPPPAKRHHIRFVFRSFFVCCTAAQPLALTSPLHQGAQSVVPSKDYSHAPP